MGRKKAEDNNKGNGHDNAALATVEAMPVDVNPEDFFGRTFSSFGGNGSGADELLSVKPELLDLIIKSDIKDDEMVAHVLNLMAADLEEMQEQEQNISMATVRRMLSSYKLAFSMARGGQARRQYLQALIGEKDRAQRRYFAERDNARKGQRGEW